MAFDFQKCHYCRRVLDKSWLHGVTRLEWFSTEHRLFYLCWPIWLVLKNFRWFAQPVRWKTLVQMRGTSSSFDWFTVLSTFVVTGHSNCFGVGYTILGELLWTQCTTIVNKRCNIWFGWGNFIFFKKYECVRSQFSFILISLNVFW